MTASEDLPCGRHWAPARSMSGLLNAVGGGRGGGAGGRGVTEMSGSLNLKLPHETKRTFLYSEVYLFFI